MDAQVMAAVLAVLAAGTIVFFDWVPTALNRNIDGMGVRERAIGGVIHALVASLIAVVNLENRRWPILLGAVWFTVVLISAVVNWWLPYAFGVHVGEISPEIFQQEYGRNLRILPRHGDEVIVPDVQHSVIHLTVLAATVSSWTSFLRS